MHGKGDLSELDAVGNGRSLLDALEACAYDLKHNLTLINPNHYRTTLHRVNSFEAKFGHLTRDA